MAFDLKSISRGVAQKAPRVTVYGPEGIGKSTFGASAHNPIFLPTEDGIDAIDCASFPLVEDYGQVNEAIGTLLQDEHDFSTLVLDTADWLEPVIWAKVCTDHGHNSIEDFGYGKGYIHAADQWRELLAGLNALRSQRNMAVILIAHAQVKRFDDPTTDPYDRYRLKMHDKAAALIQEWSDVIGFASQRVITQKEDVGFNKKAARGIAVGERMLHVIEQPAFVAKNRYGLPPSIPLSWQALVDAIAEAQTTNKEQNNG